MRPCSLYYAEIPESHGIGLALLTHPMLNRLPGPLTALGLKKGGDAIDQHWLTITVSGE